MSTLQSLQELGPLELLELLEADEPQTPEDWLASDISFYNQEIVLEPFGYDLFAGVPTTFAPATDIPVPPSYLLGPGDTVEIQLFGKENRQYSLVVTRDGTINFPNVGPLNVMGLNFHELKERILDYVAEKLLGTSVSVTMGALRSIQVFVLGEARRPGAYTVSGLSTITNALFVSGGVKEIGSLRNIQLKRNGRLVQTIDLYDLLIRGDTKHDVRLQPGDAIFIPTIGPTVGVGGFVKRSAVYELKNEKTVADAITLAGGFRPDAFPELSRLERIGDDFERGYINLDLSAPGGLQNTIKTGDIVLVPPVLEGYRDGVRLARYVRRPGNYEWHEGMRLTDLIPSLADLKPQSDINYALIRRETWPEKRVKALSADLENAINHPDSSDNVLLEPRDVVTVFDLKPERAELVEPLLEELRLQATSEDPFEKVSIGGRVRAPGTYPFERGMRVSDLLRAGANLSEAAYELNAEMARFEIIDGTIRRTRVISINPEAALMGDPEADILLEPYDSLQIREVQEWRDQLSVEITGEVRFPGNYSFNPGDTLVSVIERAGGLTDQAFPQGGIFLREQLREREIEQIDLLTQRIESDLASLALQAANENAAVQQAQSAGNALLSKLRNTRATGRLVIDLQAMLANPDNHDVAVLLKSGDQLMIPDISQDVTVLGEVQFPTSHLYIEGLDRSGYVDRSGGMTINAAEKQVYLVRANGAVFTGKTGWFGRGDSMRVEPGDTIVVPLDTQKVSKLQLWTNVTGVIYNLSIAVAAINGLND
jgi:protein involved in polysaccharide export with SLBB domain